MLKFSVSVFSTDFFESCSQYSRHFEYVPIQFLYYLVFICRRAYEKKILVKANSLFCIKFVFFHQMIALQKLWKIFFISSKQLFSFSRYSNFYNFFPCFPHFPDSKGQIIYMSWIYVMMSWTGLHKFEDVIFGITQKLLYITSSNLIIYYIMSKGIFLNLFCNLKSDRSLVPDPFCFW